jgi:hypothetical protein
MDLTPALLRTIINNFWMVYGKTEDDFKLRDNLILMLNSLHTFWVMKHLILHCDFHKWNLCVGIANDPIRYYSDFINERVHLYDKGFLI